MSDAVGGVLEFKVRGEPLELEASLTVSPGSIIREGMAGATGGGGYKETWKIPFIEGTLIDVPEGFSSKDLETITDETVIARLRNGRTYTLYHAWSTQAPDIAAVDGTMPIRFECLPRNVREVKEVS